MYTYKVKNLEMLIGTIGFTPGEPCFSRVTEVRIVLWDERVIRGSNQWVTLSSKIDTETPDHMFRDMSELKPLVENLLKSGESFVTKTGIGVMTCIMRWTISK